MTGKSTVPGIRRLSVGDEYQLWLVFHSAVHDIACSHYSPAQLDAWAPAEYPGESWSTRIQRNNPLVAEWDGRVVGFADIQPNGYIDQFFVSGAEAGKGVGDRLMQELEKIASTSGVACMYSNVSLNAQPFFKKHGFVIERHQEVTLRGVKFRNARMRKDLRG